MVRVCIAHFERAVLTNICSDANAPNPDGFRGHVGGEQHHTKDHRREREQEATSQGTETFPGYVGSFLRIMGYETPAD